MNKIQKNIAAALVDVDASRSMQETPEHVERRLALEAEYALNDQEAGQKMRAGHHVIVELPYGCNVLGDIREIYQSSWGYNSGMYYVVLDIKEERRSDVCKGKHPSKDCKHINELLGSQDDPSEHHETLYIPRGQLRRISQLAWKYCPTHWTEFNSTVYAAKIKKNKGGKK